LIFDVLGGPSHPFGEDDLLVLSDVGDGIDRHRPAHQTCQLPVKRCNYYSPAYGKYDEYPDYELVGQAQAKQFTDERFLFCGEFSVVLTHACHLHVHCDSRKE
jgi:hypothetical protein